MHITLSGQNIAFTGKIAGYTKPSLTKHLHDHGANVAPAPKKGVTLMLVGTASADKKVNQARALGITVVEGEVLDALLRDGEVTWESAQGVATVRDVIGELRALLDGKPDPAKWRAIVALVDQCDPAQLEDMTAYLQPQLQAWQRGPEGPFEGSRFRYAGLFYDAAGALRVTTADWLTELLRGESSAKHGLLSAITFEPVTVSSAAASAIFDHPDLSQITTFDIGYTVPAYMFKASFYKKMAQATNLASVETLVLRTAPDGALVPLLTTQALPALKRLVMHPTGRCAKTQDGAALITGPWANQLESLALMTLGHARHLAAHHDALPALRELAALDPNDFYAGATLSEDDQAWIDALAASMRSIDTLRLCIPKPHRLEAMLQKLTPQAAPALRVLDLSVAPKLTLSGQVGVSWAQRALVESGLCERLERVIVGEAVALEVCDALRDAGVEVISPLAKPQPAASADEGAPRSGAPYTPITQLADGESARVREGRAHVHDALMFEAPSEQAWRVVLGVANALVLREDEATARQAIAALHDAISSWPDALRVCPQQWAPLLFQDAADPRLSLVRALHLSRSQHFYDARTQAQWLNSIAASAHVGHITHLEVFSFDPQRGILDALDAVVKATQAATYYLVAKSKSDEAKLAVVLDEAGCKRVSARLEGVTPRDTRVTLDDLDHAELTLQIDSIALLTQLLQLEAMEHIVSLQLDIQLPYDQDDAIAAALNQARAAGIAAPRWTRLRYLSVRLGGGGVPELDEALARWLGAARPLHVELSCASWHRQVYLPELLAARGAYARAYASTLELCAMGDPARFLAAINHPDVRVAAIRPDDQACAARIGTQPLVDAMHPHLRDSLTHLSWFVRPEDLEAFEPIVTALPRLVRWHIYDNIFTSKEGRALTIEAIAKAPRARALPFIALCDRSSLGKNERLTSAELKPLAKGPAPAFFILTRKGDVDLF